MQGDPALALLAWLSPAFPVGSFAYSHGLEWAHEAGDITDFTTGRDWISDLLTHGSGRNDAILLSASWRAVTDRNADQLREVAELALALQPSSERYLESSMQGKAFLLAARAAWPSDALDFLTATHQGDLAYPIALGAAAAGSAIPLDRVLDAFLLAFVSNLVSASVRLGVIGQTDGQRVIAALMPLVRDEARKAETATLDNLGSSVFRSDLASLQHETQYTRLFRS